MELRPLLQTLRAARRDTKRGATTQTPVMVYTARLRRIALHSLSSVSTYTPTAVPPPGSAPAPHSPGSQS